MTRPQLAIVIHAEEEFDWNSGFYRSNTSVTHDNELISFVEEIIELGGKVTFAMDYPFVTSAGGRTVIEKFKALEGEKIEFAAHLHPWVNPPFEDDNDQVSSKHSYPCNLAKDLEFAKLKVLTEVIEKATGTKPTTYLAGRYGIGGNSAAILKELGYKVDLSVSAYCDFSHQQGPDFSRYSNKRFEVNQLTYLPHTCSVLSVAPLVEDHLNRNPKRFSQLQSNVITGLLAKLFRIRRYRLSPEGFTFQQMKQLTEAQLRIGQQEFVMSFHSPSVKAALTPYVKSENERKALMEATLSYLTHFQEFLQGEIVLPKYVMDGGKNGSK